MEEKELPAIEEVSNGYVSVDMDNLKEGILQAHEVDEAREPGSGTILQGETIAEKLRSYEEFLDKAPRKFRRKFVREKFSDRMRKTAII